MPDYLIRRASFCTPLHVEPTGTKRQGREEFRLLTGFSFELGGFGSGWFIDVPAGFITDFASIPWPAYLILPPRGPWGKASVIHDYMYATSNQNRYYRGFADLVFLNGMRLLGVSTWKSLTLYWAVRLFGARNFGKDEAEITYS
jgi:hypothetical protein